MIARMWHGWTPSDSADEYTAYLERTGAADLASTAGNLGAYVFRRLEGDRAHFVVLSLWDAADSIRAFAGADIDRARYYPEDQRYLLEMPETVEHYEVVVRSR